MQVFWTILVLTVPDGAFKKTSHFAGLWQDLNIVFI
jgi:hypothetical protein